MMDMKEFAERFARLEERSKANFFEIEKRLVNLESALQGAPTTNLNERIDEIEDLLLLLQLENTKIKELVGSGVEHVTGAMPERIEQRLVALEDKNSLPGGSEITTEDMNDIKKQIENLSKSKVTNDYEKRLDNIEEAIKGIEEHLDTLKLDELESEIKTAKKQIEEVVKTPKSDTSKMTSKLGEEITMIGNRLENLENFFSKEMSAIDKRLSKIEYHSVSYEDKTKDTVEKESVLQDVHRILNSR